MEADDDLTAAALEYHTFPTFGMISVIPTKGLTNRRDLALAYLPRNAIVSRP